MSSRSWEKSLLVILLTLKQSLAWEWPVLCEELRLTTSKGDLGITDHPSFAGLR